ncbi:MAG: extracellular solute-binding protein [Candidatus Limivivens sp.]|nr:extracellular solute-binding protein [Candidatus Limivivens sp.]
MMKKSVAVTLAGIMALSALPLGVCAEESGDKVNVTVMCAYASEDPHGQYVYQYAEEFMAEHPEINVEIQAISSNDIYTKLAAMVTSPDDLPTLFFTSVDQAPTLYDLGMMEDLNGLLDEETKAMFADGVLDACTLDETLAFYPIDVQPSAILYRTDRFAEAGLEVPTTWEEFLECAKALTTDSDGDGEIDQWGFSMVGSNNSSGQSRFMSYLWSNGCNLVSYDEENEEWVADLGDNFTELLTFWTDMNNVLGVVPTGITEVDYATAANYFAMGYTSMMLTGSNAIGVAYANNADLKGNIGSFPIPGESAGTMLNAEGYAVCSYAADEEKAAAVEFLKFFSTHDSELMFWQSSGKIPATVEGEKAEYITGDDYKGYLDTVANGCLAPVNFAGISGLKSLLGDAYAAVFSGEKTNEEAVATLESALEELLEDYN